MKIDLSGHYNKGRIMKTVWPSMIMLLVTQIYSIVDGVFISNFTGTTAFAAVNLVLPALMMIAAIGLMIGTGGSALVAKTLGEGNRRLARRIFSMLTRFAILIGIIVSVLLIVLMKPICIFLGGEGELLDIAVTYGRLYSIGMPFMILQMAFQSFYMTAERPQLGMKVAIACGIINIIFDALFIAVFGWGYIGAAIATVLSLMFGGMFPLFYFSSRKNNSQLHLVRAKFNWRYIGQSNLNGLSEMVAIMALSFLSMCYNWQLLRYIGESGVATYGIMMYVTYIFSSMMQGYNIGISPVISYNYGAKNYSELHSLLKKNLFLILVMDAIICMLCQSLAYPLSAIFVSYDPELLAFTTRSFRIYSSAFLLWGFSYFGSAFFTALNNGPISALLSFARMGIFETSCVWILPLLFGIDGIWLAWPTAEILTIILTFTILIKYRKRYGY